MPGSNKDFVLQTELFAAAVGLDVNELRKLKHEALTLGPNNTGFNLVGQILQLESGFAIPTGNEIANWNALIANIGNYALNNGSNITNPSNWRTQLDVYSTSEINNFLSGKQNKLTAGANVQISPTDVISANDTTYSSSNGILQTGTNFSPVYGTAANTIAQGNDSRFHNPVTVGTSNGLSMINQVVSMALAGALSTGALSAADWNAFNNKISANNGIIEYVGTGAIIGGGSSSANQTANTSFGFDLTAQTKSDILQGVTAMSLLPNKANLDGSNITNPANWRTQLDVYNTSQVNSLLSGKQNKLTAGANISISPTDVISAIDTTYSSSNGILQTGTNFSPVYGTAANTIAQGNDSRFHNPVTVGTSNGLSMINQVVSMALAGALSTGALSAADWNTFNNKISANNGNMSYVGSGAITGGGISSANQSTNTNYSFDLTPQTKSDIGLGVTAYNLLGNYQTALSNGLSTVVNGNKIDVAFENNVWIKGKNGKDYLKFGNSGSTTDDVYFKRGYVGGNFTWLDADDSPLMQLGAGGILKINANSGTNTRLAVFDQAGGLFHSNIDINDVATEAYVNNHTAQYYAQKNGGNITNIATWQTALGIDLINSNLSNKANIDGGNITNAVNWRSLLNLYSIAQVDSFLAGKANTNGYYPGLSVGIADGANGLVGSGGTDMYGGSVVSNGLQYVLGIHATTGIYKFDATALNFFLGINNNWNLQQVAQNGNTSTLPLIIQGTSYAGGSIFQNSDFTFLTYQGNALRVATGGLLSSDNYTDLGLIPVNGGYFKGTIATLNHYTSTEWATAYNIAIALQNSMGNYVPYTGATQSLLMNNWSIADVANIYTNGYGSADQWNAKLGAGSNISLLNNDSGYITTASLNGYATELWVINRYIDFTTQNQIVNSNKVFSVQGNTYTSKGVESRGNGSTLYPGYGFHQPNIYGASLEMHNDALLYWDNEALSTRNWTVNNFASNTALANYVPYSGATQSIDLNNKAIDNIANLYTNGYGSADQWNAAYNAVQNLSNDYVARFNINQSVNGVKSFTGAYTEWVLNGDATNNARGFIQSLPNEFLVGTLNADKNLSLYRGGVPKLTIYGTNIVSVNPMSFEGGIAVGGMPNILRMTRQSADMVGFLSDSNGWADVQGNIIYSYGFGNSTIWNAKLGAGSNISLLNNDAGYVTNSALGNFAFRGALTNFDLNNLYEAGIYSGYNLTNAVGNSGGDFAILNIPNWAGNSSSDRYNLQISSGAGASSGELWFRTTNANGAGAWRAVWNTSNLLDPATQTWVNSRGFLTSYAETDPTVPSHVKAIQLASINYWNDKFDFPVGGNANQYLNGLGQLSTFPTIPTNNNQLANGANYTTLPIVQTWVGTQGFLTSFTETDPTVPSHVKAITIPNISYWNGKADVSQILNGLLAFSVSADFASGSFNFSANQGTNVSPTLVLSATVKNDISTGVAAFNSLGNYIPIGRTITINQQTIPLNNNPNFTISAVAPPRTTENVTVSGGGNVPLQMRKTRVTIMDAGVYDIPNGTEEGDSLFIVFCEANGDFGGQLNIKHMNKCTGTANELLFASNRSYYFWWSANDGCWLGLLL